MTAGFKPGDKVRCLYTIPFSGGIGLVQGETYTIHSVNPFNIVTLDEADGGWYEYRFVLVDNSSTIQITELK